MEHRCLRDELAIAERPAAGRNPETETWVAERASTTRLAPKLLSEGKGPAVSAPPNKPLQQTKPRCIL